MNLFEQMNQNFRPYGSILLAGCAFLGSWTDLQAQGTLVVPFGSNKELAPAHKTYQFPYEKNYIMLPLTNGTVSTDGGRTIIVNKPVKISTKRTTVIPLGHGAPNVSPTPVVPMGFNGGSVPRPVNSPGCAQCAAPYPVVSQPAVQPGASLYVPQNTTSPAMPQNQTYAETPLPAGQSVLTETDAGPGTAPLPAPVENMPQTDGSADPYQTSASPETPSDAGTSYGAGTPSDEGTSYGAGTPSDAGTSYGAGTPSDAGTSYGAGAPSDAGTGTPSDSSTDSRSGEIKNWEDAGPTSSQNSHSNSEQSAWRTPGKSSGENGSGVLEMRGSPMIPSDPHSGTAKTLEIHSAKPPVISEETLEEAGSEAESKKQKEPPRCQWKTIQVTPKRNVRSSQGKSRSIQEMPRNEISTSRPAQRPEMSQNVEISDPSSAGMLKSAPPVRPVPKEYVEPEVRPVPSQLPDPEESKTYPGSTFQDDGRTV